MGAKYFLLHMDEDGDMTVRAMTADKVHAFIQEAVDEGRVIKWADTIPASDPNYWNGAYILIKGELVVPQATVTVTKYTVP